MKKFLLTLCAAAILLTSTACSCANDSEGTADDTEEIVEKETIDIDGDGKSDGYKIEGISGTEDDPSNNSNDPDGENDIVPDTEIMKSEVIAEGGTEPGLWPTESVPENVPEYNDYKQMYDVTHDDLDTSENWYMSFDSTEKSYEDYIAKLREDGYKESDKISGFWGNGEQILDVFTEEVDGELCVSIDIIKSKPVVYPDAVKNIFPEFNVSDSTLYGWYDVEKDGGKLLSVSYACGENFAIDLNAYKNKLSEAGFTVTQDQASIEKDGKTYIVRYGDAVSRYEDCLEYVY